MTGLSGIEDRYISNLYFKRSDETPGSSRNSFGNELKRAEPWWEKLDSRMVLILKLPFDRVMVHFLPWRMDGGETGMMPPSLLLLVFGTLLRFSTHTWADSVLGVFPVSRGCIYSAFPSSRLVYRAWAWFSWGNFAKWSLTFGWDLDEWGNTTVNSNRGSVVLVAST